MTTVDRVAAPPTAGRARGWLRARRRNRSSVRQRITNLLDALLYTGILVGLAIGAARASLDRAVGGVTASHEPGLVRWLVGCSAIVVVAAGVKLLISFGPVLVRPAAQVWLLSSPIDRRALLWPRFGGLVLTGALGGAALATATLTATGLSTQAWPSWLGSGAAFGVLVVSAAVLLQSALRRTVVAQRILNMIMAATVLAAAVGSAFGATPAFPWSAAESPVVIAVPAFLAAAWAYVRLAALTRARLSTGVELAETTAVAATFLDPTVLSGVLLIRRTRAIARVRSARIRGGRVGALIRADLTRVRRLWLGPAAWVALLPVPYVLRLVAPTDLVAGAHLIAAFLATDRLAGGLRLVCRSAALRRALGGRDRWLRLTHLVVPGSGAVLWCALTAAALPSPPILLAAVSALSALAVCYRIATRPPMDYSSAMFDIGFGAAPIGLVIQLARGPALLFGLTWVQVLLAE